MKAPLRKDWQDALDVIRAAVPDPERSEVSRVLRKVLNLDESLDPLDAKNWPVPIHGLHRPTDKVLQLPIVLAGDSLAQKAMFMIPVTIGEPIPTGTNVIGNVGLEAGTNTIGSVIITDGVDELDVIQWNSPAAGGNGIAVAGRAFAGDAFRWLPVAAYNDLDDMKGIYVIPVTHMTGNRHEGIRILGNRCQPSRSIYSEGEPYYNIILNYALQQVNTIIINTAGGGTPSGNFRGATGNIVKIIASANFAVNFYLDCNLFGNPRMSPTIYLAANSTVEIGAEHLCFANFGNPPQPVAIRLSTSAFGLTDNFSICLQGYVD